MDVHDRTGDRVDEDREPTAHELDVLNAAFARLDLHPAAEEHEALAATPRAVDARESAETAAFLRALRGLDAALEGRFRRRRRSFRAGLRRRAFAEGILVRPGREGWVARGLGLAWEYARLRLRESRALRVASVLLLVNLLAVPVAALIAKVEREREERIHRLDLLREDLRFEPLPDDTRRHRFHEDVPAEAPQDEAPGGESP